MARLTRTQKYAELRDQISHDREESIESQQLQQYEDKFNNLTGLNSNNSFQQNQQQPVQQQPVNLVDNPQTMSVSQNSQPMPINQQNFQNNNFNQNMQNNQNFVQPQMDPRQMLNNRVQNLEGAINNNPNQFYPNNNQQISSNYYNNQMRNNDFINSTFQEVNTYNRQNGNASLDDLSNQLIYDIRNQDPQKIINNGINNQNLPYGYPNNIQNNIQPQQSVESPFIDETVEMNSVNHNYPNPNEPYNQQTQYPNNMPMGIKNINDANGYKVQHDFVDDTMPFNINKTKREEKDVDYEEEVPNKALNVILGILIFVLVVVLGIIIYYILVARGIIS